jgi:hypothetical protein
MEDLIEHDNLMNLPNRAFSGYVKYTASGIQMCVLVELQYAILLLACTAFI